METRILKAHLLLLLTAFIWGFAFVAQRVGMRHTGPFFFNAVRFALGAATLVPFLLTKRNRQPKNSVDHGIGIGKVVLYGGGLAGVLVFAGASLQQVGIVYTTAGKAGFITGLYVIIVPILALTWGHRSEGRIWIGAVLAAVGMYFLSVSESLTVSSGDLLVLVGAFFWACHVHLIGYLSTRTNPLELAFFQYLVCSVLSLVVALFMEVISLSAIRDAFFPIVYAGIFSVGVAYTLQVVAQRDALPGHVAIILSMETVFAVVGGRLILGEILSERGLLGCGLMLTGMIVSQLTFGRRSSG